MAENCSTLYWFHMVNLFFNIIKFHNISFRVALMINRSTKVIYAASKIINPFSFFPLQSAAAAAAPPEDPAELLSAGGDDDEVTTIPAIEEKRSKKKKFDQKCQQSEGFVLEKVNFLLFSILKQNIAFTNMLINIYKVFDFLIIKLYRFFMVSVICFRFSI